MRDLLSSLILFNKPVTHIPEYVTAFMAENDQCVHNINVLILKIELLTRKEAANYDAIVLLQVKMSFLVDAANSVCWVFRVSKSFRRITLLYLYIIKLGVRHS